MTKYIENILHNQISFLAREFHRKIGWNIVGFYIKISVVNAPSET